LALTSPSATPGPAPPEALDALVALVALVTLVALVALVAFSNSAAAVVMSLGFAIKLFRVMGFKVWN